MENLFISGVSRIVFVSLLVSMRNTEVFDVGNDSSRNILLAASGANVR